MPRNFSDFTKEDIKTPNEEFKNFKEEDLKEKYDEYSKMPKSELEKKLYEEIERSKADGTFDAEVLRSSVLKITPYLPSDDRERLLALLDRITCKEVK